MVWKTWAGHGVLGIAVLLVVGASFAGDVAATKAQASGNAALNAKIVSRIRAKFPIPVNVKLTVDSFQSTRFPGFLASTITADDGKNPKKNPIYLSSDHRFLILGQLLPLGSDLKGEVVRRVREQYKVPQASNVSVGAIHNSSFLNFLAIPVSVDDGKHKQEQDFYITKDNYTLVLGDILDLGVNLRQRALRTIVTRNQPSQGPARAPVTIVEYGDLECPMCGRLHEFLEKELLPKYSGKVRVIFKEFPLVGIHEWSFTAAIANECVFQIKPEAFVPYRSLIFQNQGVTSAATIRDSLLAYADQVGVDRVKVASCLDSKASLPRVDAGSAEGKRLDISSTPTSFINGQMLVGFPSPETYYQAVDEALKEARKGQ